MMRRIRAVCRERAYNRQSSVLVHRFCIALVFVGALLYLLSAIGTLALVRRFVTISRPVSTVLILLPLCLTGRALVTGRVYAPIDLNYHFDPLASMATRVGIDRIANPLPSDVAVQFLPWNAALRWSIAHKQWPP